MVRTDEHHDTSGVLNPFAPNQTQAFAPAFAAGIASEWAHRESEVRRHAHVERLLANQAGLCYNSLGLSFSSEWDFGSELMRGPVNRILTSGSRSKQQEAARIVLANDVAAQRQTGRSRGIDGPTAANASAMVDELDRASYAKIDRQWKLAELLMGKPHHSMLMALNTTATFNNAFAHVWVPPGQNASEKREQEAHIYGMGLLREQLLPTLRAVARAYIGPEATYGGYTLLRLFGRDLSEADYVSGNWHHDRCGRRLKCFVYLQRTTEEHHPPRIAPGSARTIFYSYDRLAESRFAAEYVEREYAVTDILGDFGEGFCFDTNAIHKGSLKGKHRRDAIIFEFHNEHKAQAFAEGKISAPCRS